MRRTLDRIRDAWATWKLYRHNVRFLRRVARDTAAYFTSFGEKLESREDAYETIVLGEIDLDAETLLNPKHVIPGADPFGRFARNLHGDSDA